MMSSGWSHSSRDPPRPDAGLGSPKAHASWRPVSAEAALARTMARVAVGDADALARLYDATVGRVYAIAERLMRDPFQAEETVLDVFQYVWDRASKFDPERGSVSSWLATITRGRSIDRLRAARARHGREVALAEEESAAPAALASEHGPARQAIDAERDDTLERALRSLSSKQRRVVELAFLHGMTHERIAESLDEPLGTIKSQIRRGLIRLHDLLHCMENDR